MGAGWVALTSSQLGVIKVSLVFIHPIAYNFPAFSPLADDAQSNQAINRQVD